MILIIGVKFRKSGKVYYFDPIGLPVRRGDHVIVETARGVEYGTVVLGPKEITDDKVIQPLKPVIRLATKEDDNTHTENLSMEAEAYQICLKKIENHNLNMKLIDSEYTFDRNKLLFYFTADGRIDFRELVKDLASVFRTRIELRQIGVRDETKLIGGIAICGRPLCCHSYLSDFVPVSIKMAKEQNLSLNPAKISGVCGRLMCCLKNEQEAYEYLNSTLPHIGMEVTTDDGYRGEVQSISVLKQKVKVMIYHKNDEREIREYHVDNLYFENKKRSSGAPAAPLLPDEELDESALKELAALEKEDDVEDLAEDSQKTYSRKKDRNRDRNQRSSRQRDDRRNFRDNRNSKDFHEERDSRNHSDNRKQKDNRKMRDFKDGKDFKDNRDYKKNYDESFRKGRNRRPHRSHPNGKAE